MLSVDDGIAAGGMLALASNVDGQASQGARFQPTLFNSSRANPTGIGDHHSLKGRPRRFSFQAVAQSFEPFRASHRS